MREIFSKYIKSENVIFKFASGVSDRNGKEFHDFNEIILFLDGDAELITDDTHIKLKPRTLIALPKETYHQMIIYGDKQNYFRCVFSFYDDPFLADLIRKNLNSAVIQYPDRDILFLFETLMSRIDEHDNERTDETILKSALALLLNKLENNNDITATTVTSPLIKSAVKYINLNLSAITASKDISDYLNVSISTLQHEFKNEMHISLYKYILKKRLVTARHMISCGTAAAVAAAELGFNDYSGFYKQYKKMFACSPSEKNQH